MGFHSGTEGPVVSLGTEQLLEVVPWILYFTEGLQNADTLVLSFPLR